MAPQNDERLEHVTAKQRLVLLGAPKSMPTADRAARQREFVQRIPAGGCLQRSYEVTMPSRFDTPALVSKIDRVSWDRSRRSPAVTAAARAWAQCMGRYGYSYTDPIAAANDPAFSHMSPGRGERQVATRDIRCKEESGFIGAWNAEDVRIQRELIRTHLAELDRVRSAQLRDLRDLPVN